MGVIPKRHRSKLRDELLALSAGARPDLLLWVNDYGDHGAVLVPQPDAIWTHTYTGFDKRSDGSAYGVVPLWTTEESPSDLSAEFEITRDGTVEITNVHVL